MRRIKLGWVLLSPPETPQPSTRIAALNVMAELDAAGYDSDILFAPVQSTERPELSPVKGFLSQISARKIDIVVFQKTHGTSVLELARALRTAGIKTVFLVCDLVHAEMARVTDATVVVTTYLRSLYPSELQHKVWVVHDGIENPELTKFGHSAHQGSSSQPLQAVLVTSAAPYSIPLIRRPPPWLSIRILGRYSDPATRLNRWRVALGPLFRSRDWNQLPATLAFLSSSRIATQGWTESRAYEALHRADIGIIPVDTSHRPEPGALPPDWMRKSENRLTLKMSLGLPVIASPVPSYLDVIVQGVNGFIADTPHDWRRCLGELRDPDLRVTMGREARATVVHRFSRERQAMALARVLAAVTGNLDQADRHSARAISR